jgi:hypothetical protein
MSDSRGAGKQLERTPPSQLFSGRDAGPGRTWMLGRGGISGGRSRAGRDENGAGRHLPYQVRLASGEALHGDEDKQEGQAEHGEAFGGASLRRSSNAGSAGSKTDFRQESTNSQPLRSSRRKLQAHRGG